MKIKEAMHEGADWVPQDTPVTEIARLMRDKDIGSVPVGKDDRLVGMVTDRDIALRVAAEGKDPGATTAEQIMTPGIIYCTTQEDVEDAVHLMDQKQIRRLPVLNEAKRMVGMLSLGDIAHTAGRELGGEVLHAVTAHHAASAASEKNRDTQAAAAGDA